MPEEEVLHELHIFARCPKCGSGKVSYSFGELPPSALNDSPEHSLVECADCGWVGHERKFLP
jgi:DNA-directed RNA polymerase subunit M/transcription elongation factor TFIIS